MNDTSDMTFKAEPAISETPTTIVESPAQAPKQKKIARAVKSAKAVKAAIRTKPSRASKGDETEETVASAQEEATNTVGKSAKRGKAVKTAKPAKQPKPEATVRAKKVIASAKTSKVEKSAKPIETTKTIKPTKGARSAKRIAKSAAIAAPAATAKSVAKGNGKGERYTTNELASASKKAGLTVEFAPVVTKPTNIGRGPAKEFKVDAIVAHLRGSNGDLIRDRGPGTPLHNDAESLAAVEIFEKFRGKTFHNKLKVEIL